MAGIRFTIDLFIPESVYNSLTLAQRTAIRDRIIQLKNLATKVGIEDTVRAKWHRCNHDTGKPCEPEQNI